MRRCARSLESNDVNALKAALLEEARRIRDEDAAMCRAIGRHGESLIGPGVGVLTHCNAGSLATAEYGTATAPMYTAHAAGRRFRVYADALAQDRAPPWERDADRAYHPEAAVHPPGRPGGRRGGG